MQRRTILSIYVVSYFRTHAFMRHSLSGPQSLLLEHRPPGAVAQTLELHATPGPQSLLLEHLPAAVEHWLLTHLPLPQSLSL